MTPIFEPKVAISQQPKVETRLHNLRFMTEPDEKQLFAKRLNEVCADKGLPERGRQTALARLFKVTATAARKWLVGVGMPETELAIHIAKWADVNFEWLMTGRGPKVGDKVPTRDLVVDEIMRHGTPEERRELINYIKYRIEHATTPVTREERARYNAALDTYATEKLRTRSSH